MLLESGVRLHELIIVIAGMHTLVDITYVCKLVYAMYLVVHSDIRDTLTISNSMMSIPASGSGD